MLIESIHIKGTLYMCVYILYGYTKKREKVEGEKWSP